MNDAYTTTEAGRKSWRDVLPVHPDADKLPLLSETDPKALLELGRDILDHGCAFPIVVKFEGEHGTGHYMLRDGRNRLDALVAVGCELEIIIKKRRNGFPTIDLIVNKPD